MAIDAAAAVPPCKRKLVTVYFLVPLRADAPESRTHELSHISVSLHSFHVVPQQ